MGKRSPSRHNSAARSRPATPRAERSPAAAPARPRAAAPGSARTESGSGIPAALPRQDPAPQRHRAACDQEARALRCGCLGVAFFAPFQLQNAHQDQDGFDWKTVFLPTAMIFMYFNILVYPGVARQNISNFYKCSGRAECGSHRNQCQLQRQMFIKSIWKTLQSIHIKIILI